jgi:hypothetical protein
MAVMLAIAPFVARPQVSFKAQKTGREPNVREEQAVRRSAAPLVVIIAIFAALLPAAIVNAAGPRPDLDRIDAYVQGLFQRSGLPGMALAVIEGDAPVYMRGFGSADARDRPITPDSLFIIGSTTKSMTALAILQLADAGKVRLDDAVTRYVPAFLAGARQARAITLRMLLHQTSGLSHEAGDQPVLDAGDTSPRAIQNWTLGLRDDALNRVPGASYEYSNANYVVLGAIVEIVSGQSYHDLHARSRLRAARHDPYLRELGRRAARSDDTRSQDVLGLERRCGSPVRARLRAGRLCDFVCERHCEISRRAIAGLSERIAPRHLAASD